jgi:MFS family permease
MGFLVDAAFLFVFLIVLQSYVPESLHKSDAIAGWALAAFGVAKLLTQLGSGFVTDRLGSRRTLIVGTALLVIADVSILPLAHVAAWLIVGAAAIEGLGSSVTWPAVYASADGRFEQGDRGKFTALLTLATGGALLAGLGGGTALHFFASFNVAMIAPIAGVSTALVIAILMPSPAHERATRAGAAPPRPGELRLILAHPQRATFAVLILAEAAALGALTAAFRAYGRDVLEVSLARQTLMLIPAAVLGGLLVVPGGAVADRIGRRAVMAPGFALTGVCLLLLARFTGPVVVVCIAAAAGAGFGLAVPAIASTMMALAASTGRRGGVIGWFMTMDGIGHAAGPALAGVLLALFGAEAVLIASGGLFLAVAWVALTSRVGEEVMEISVAEDRMAPQVKPVAGGSS